MQAVAHALLVLVFQQPVSRDATAAKSRDPKNAITCSPSVTGDAEAKLARGRPVLRRMVLKLKRSLESGAG
jgi:hypothetical protein